MMPDDDYSIVIIDKIIIDVIMLMQSSTIAAVGKRAELYVNVVCALATDRHTATHSVWPVSHCR